MWCPFGAVCTDAKSRLVAYPAIHLQWRDLRYFSAFANVHTLKLQALESDLYKSEPQWAYESRLEDHRNTMVVDVFSTITFPVYMFSELVIALRHHATDLSHGITFLKALQRMNGIRPSKLVFLLEVSDFQEERRELTKALDSVTTRGLLDFLDSPPTIH